MIGQPAQTGDFSSLLQELFQMFGGQQGLGVTGGHPQNTQNLPRPQQPSTLTPGGVPGPPIAQPQQPAQPGQPQQQPNLPTTPQAPPTSGSLVQQIQQLHTGPNRYLI